MLFLQLILIEDFPTKWTICKHLLATTVYLQIKPGEKKKEPLTILRRLTRCLTAWHRYTKMGSSYWDSNRNTSLDTTEVFPVKVYDPTRCNFRRKRVFPTSRNQMHIQDLQDITNALNCTLILKETETGFRKSCR